MNQANSPESSAEAVRPRLRVVALLSGPPCALELWTLQALALEPIDLLIIQAHRPTGLTRRRRLKALANNIGPLHLLSRIAGNLLLGRWQNRKRERHLELLLDGNRLRAWWRGSGLRVIEVPYLNHDDTRAALLNLAPDLVIRVSGGVLSKKIFSVARLGTINIHHGIAPMIRGVWSIAWGLIENRKEWIGATVHFIDEGIDTGNVLWRGSPQICPGDTGVTLFFRAHLRAVSALARVVSQFAAGRTPKTIQIPAAEESVYRTVPELPHWLRYTLMRRGRDADVVLRQAIEC
jgi:Formyl transferase